MGEIKVRGSYDKTEKFLVKVRDVGKIKNIDRYGKEGVRALSQNTPKRTGETGESWSYKVINNSDGIGINWYNSNVNDGISIAVIIQYGHNTGSGGYVIGRDYINPSIIPVFDKISNDLWMEVHKCNV